MALVVLDLPTPEQMRGPWAALAAIDGALGHHQACYAEGPRWHYDDGGGNWIDLYHLGDGRAVLTGNDHECSPDPDEGFDPMDGAPRWWEPSVRKAVQANENVAIVYGFDGTVWQRVESDVDDGFHAVALPALSTRDTRERIANRCCYTGHYYDPDLQEPSHESINALIAADAAITEEMVTAVLGTERDADPAAGVAHARRFLEA